MIIIEEKPGYIYKYPGSSQGPRGVKDLAAAVRFALPLSIGTLGLPQWR